VDLAVVAELRLRPFLRGRSWLVLPTGLMSAATSSAERRAIWGSTEV
jgi:hypothetical protein